jgi:hypothetical protein
MSGMKTIQIEVSDEEYAQLDATKDEFGLTWRGMLLFANRELSHCEE